MSTITPEQIRAQQEDCMRLRRTGAKLAEIAKQTGLSIDQVRRRINGARKRERLDPQLARRLEAQGITDFQGLHSGWLLEKDEDGSGSSLYFYLGPDEEKISFAEAILEVLGEIPRLPQLPPPLVDPAGKGYANWIMLADLHLGQDYGNPELEQDFRAAIDRLVVTMQPAEKAFLFELGDLFDANDHKGITPGSGNLLEVKKYAHLENTKLGVKLLRWAIYRLLEVRREVEVHFIPGNHDETAYVAVMLALQEHFGDNPRVNIVVSDAPFRVVPWGQCAAFPNHGDKLSWEALKGVWTDVFPDEWAAARIHRHILTAHLHTDRKKDLGKCVAEHFRTLSKPNEWARGKGLFGYGTLTSTWVHKDRGEEGRASFNITRKT